MPNLLELERQAVNEGIFVQKESLLPEKKILWTPKGDKEWSRISTNSRPSVINDGNLAWTEVQVHTYVESKRSLLQKLFGKANESAIAGPENIFFERLSVDQRQTFLLWLTSENIRADAEFSGRFERTEGSLEKVSSGIALLHGVKPLELGEYKKSFFFKQNPQFSSASRLPDKEAKNRDMSVLAAKLKDGLNQFGQVTEDINQPNAKRLGIFIGQNHSNAEEIKKFALNPALGKHFLSHHGAIQVSLKMIEETGGNSTQYFVEGYRPDSQKFFANYQNNILQAGKFLRDMESCMRAAEVTESVAKTFFGLLDPNDFQHTNGFGRFQNHSILSGNDILSRLHGIDLSDDFVNFLNKSESKFMELLVKNPHAFQKEFNMHVSDEVLQRNKTINSYVAHAMTSVLGEGQVGVCVLGAGHFKKHAGIAADYSVEEYLRQTASAKDMRILVFDPVHLSDI